MKFGVDPIVAMDSRWWPAIADALIAAGARVVISELDTPEAREDFATLEFVPTASVYSSISVKAATRGQRNEALWVGGSL